MAKATLSGALKILGAQSLSSAPRMTNGHRNHYVQFGMQARFSLQALFLIVTLSCLAATVVGWIAAGSKKGRENHFRALMAHDSRIQNVSIGGYEEEFGLFDVTTVRFTIRGKPDSCIVLFIPNGESDLRSLNIYQIGNISPILLEWDAHAGNWSPRCPSLGQGCNYCPHLRWKNLTITDVVSLYDELIQFFKEWPTYPDYRTVATESGAIVRYYIEPENFNSKHEFIPSD